MPTDLNNERKKKRHKYLPLFVKQALVTKKYIYTLRLFPEF